MQNCKIPKLLSIAEQAALCPNFLFILNTGPGLAVIKSFSCSTQLSMNFILIINMLNYPAHIQPSLNEDHLSVQLGIKFVVQLPKIAFMSVLTFFGL